jgi:hypothetical protein
MVTIQELLQELEQETHSTRRRRESDGGEVTNLARARWDDIFADSHHLTS